MASGAAKPREKQYRDLDDLIGRLRSGKGDRGKLVAQVEAQLPAESGAGDPVGTARHRVGHRFRKVRNLVGSPHFDQALTEFAEATEEHRQLGTPQLGTRQLGTRKAPARRGRATAAELASATREQLYAMAKEADVPGRSGMNKDDLVRALRKRR